MPEKREKKVTKMNVLLESIHSTTLQEYRVLNLILSRVNPKKDESGKEYVVTAEDN